MAQATSTPPCPHHDSGRRHHLPGYLIARRGPLMWLVQPDGDVCCGVDGLYAAGRRLLSLWRISVDGRSLLGVSAHLFSADGMRVVSYVSPAHEQSRDSQVTLSRIRIVRTSGAAEQIEVVNRGDAPFTATLRLSASCNLATPCDVRAGAPGEPRPWHIEQGMAIAFDDDGAVVTVRLPSGADVARPRPDLLQLSWEVKIPPGGSWRALIVIRASAPQ